VGVVCNKLFIVKQVKIKVNVELSDRLITCQWRHRRGVSFYLYPCLILTMGGCGRLALRPGRFTSGKEPVSILRKLGGIKHIMSISAGMFEFLWADILYYVIK